jgi:hypothetical protein
MRATLIAPYGTRSPAIGVVTHHEAGVQPVPTAVMTILTLTSLRIRSCFQTCTFLKTVNGNLRSNSLQTRASLGNEVSKRRIRTYLFEHISDATFNKLIDIALRSISFELRA